MLAAAWLLAFVGAELLARAAVSRLPGSSTLRRLVYPSRFSLHRMARPVDDARVATLIPGYQGVLRDDDYPETAPWPVAIDENGFRGQADRYRDSPRVIVLIGDSVPFGWGVPDEASVPAQLYGLLRAHGIEDVGVLNGAVPSYSLAQAVERFKREIADRYPVVSVVVQTLDPAIAFALLGETWSPSVSLHTRYREPTAPLMGRWEDYLDKSLLLTAALRLAYRLADEAPTTAVPAIAEPSWRRFDAANAAALLTLMEMAEARGASVVLLPVNPGPDPAANYSEGERTAIDHFNRFLATFASDRPGVYYWNVAEPFRAAATPDTLFIDPCCHLSERGARIQARFLFDRYVESGLLAARQTP